MSMAAHSTLSGLLCAIVCLPLADLGSIKWVDLLILAAFGTITIGVANVIYMRGVRKVPAAEASLIGLLDTIFAPLWVWMIFTENPGDGAIIGGLVVLGAVIFQILGDMQGKRKKSGL
jgi:drug/metabolite transporter (DMT)-like permease